MGTRELNQGEVFFDNVRVSKAALVHGPDTYEAELAAHLSLTTPMVGVWSVGLARAAFDEALAYARQREQGGKLLVDHPNVQDKLFEHVPPGRGCAPALPGGLRLQLEQPAPERASPSTASPPRPSRRRPRCDVASDAIQIFGGNGISREYLIEKLFRDARCTMICDGSNDSLSIAGGHTVAKTYPRA